MRNLKSILLVALFLCTVCSADAQFLIGVKGGLNASTISGFEYDDDYFDYEGLDYKAGFHAGIMVQYMFLPNMGFESGLYYSLMGGQRVDRITGFGEDVKIEASLNPSYLQMPFLFVYKFKLRPDFYLYPAGGMYFGYGLGGNAKLDVYSDGKKMDGESYDYDFFGDGFRRFDMGLSMSANMQYKKFVCGVGFEAGFIRINKVDDFGDRTANFFNENLKVSVGYLF